MKNILRSCTLFVVIAVFIFIQACNDTKQQESIQNTAVETVDHSDDPAYIAQKGIEIRCRNLSQGYLEVVNFQKVDGVRAKDMRGIETYSLKCSYQVKGLKSGGYLNQCRADQNLLGVTVAFAPNKDDCFNFPVVEGQIYYLENTDISTYTPNFSFSLEKHDNGWVFAKPNG